MFSLRSINPFLKLGLVFIIIYLLAGTSLYYLEQEVNPRCQNVFDAFWITTVFFFSGFEDFGPITRGGKLISLLVFVLGAGIMVMVTAKIASIFVRHELKEVKMPKKIQRHLAICNWNERGDRIVKELHAPQAEPQTEIVVVTTKELNEKELRKSVSYKKVTFIKSDPTLHDVLRVCNVHLAKSVIILADDDSPDPDAKSALIALAISRLCGDNSKPHIVVEATNHRKVEHLKDAGAAEVVCSTDYGLGVLAQCALHAKLSIVYDNLLTYSDDTNEIYIVEGEKFPKSVIGKTFIEAMQLLSEARDEHNPAILIGVKRNEQSILNPLAIHNGSEDNAFEKFEEGDALIVLSYDQPDLSYIDNHHLVLENKPAVISVKS